MRILFITSLYSFLSAFMAGTETTNTLSSNTGLRCTPAPVATNIIYQSKDGGQTWQDISFGLPQDKAPEDFFAGESEIYLRMADAMYRSKTNLSAPQWVKENGLVVPGTCIGFSRSGVLAYNYDGELFKKTLPGEFWLPIYRNLEPRLVRTVFEMADGSVLVGSDHGLFKSDDRGKSWRQVQNQGWVMEVVEAEGVLIAAGEKGIMRSTDRGENWEWVISDGGVGIEVERITGGFAAISASSSSISRRIHISLDQGKTWKAIDEGLRPSLSISSIKQVGPYLLCGHPDGVFRSSDLGETWFLVHTISEKKVKNIGSSWTVVDSRVEGKVLKLFTSGDTVYAVVRDEGC